MNKYRITYYRPYLPHPECDEAQRTEVTAKDEADVRAIYAGCEVTEIVLVEEELHPAEVAYELEKAMDEGFEDDWCDNGLFDDRPYRPATEVDEIPF